MSDPKANKNAESIIALKNANKHLNELFKDLAKKDLVLVTCAGDLQRVANQVGDIKVMVYVGQNNTPTSLKAYLNQIAVTLNEAR